VSKQIFRIYLLGAHTGSIYIYVYTESCTYPERNLNRMDKPATRDCVTADDFYRTFALTENGKAKFPAPVRQSEASNVVDLAEYRQRRDRDRQTKGSRS
jgi:hypothetical protein